MESKILEQTGNGPFLTLAFICTPQEQAEAKSFLIRHQIGNGSKFRTRIVLLVILGGLLLRAESMARAMSHNDLMFWGPFLLVVWAIAFAVIKKRSRSTVSSKFEFFADRFVVRSAGVEVQIFWKSVRKVIETPKCILLRGELKDLGYVIPRRMLPAVEWEQWIRDAVSNAAESGGVGDEVADSDGVAEENGAILNLRRVPSFSNAIKQAMASTVTWGMIFGWMGVQLGAFIWVGLQNNPDAVVPIWKLFLFYLLPIILVGSIVLVSVLSLKIWILISRQPTVTYELLEDQILVRTDDEICKFEWSAFRSFKESPWSFVIGKTFNQFPMMLPKSAFSNPDELELCRALLTRKLKKTLWFV